MSIHSSQPVTGRAFALIVILLLGLVADAVLNDEAFSNPASWERPKQVPSLGEPGFDLRIYRNGSAQLFRGENPYAKFGVYPAPPFAAVFFYPFNALSDRSGYAAQYWLLLAFNFASIGLIGWCLHRARHDVSTDRHPELISLTLCGLVVFVVSAGHFHSYGLKFGLERGNFDGYILPLTTAGIASMLAWPTRVLLPVVLFSAATHLKVYPAILFLLPLLVNWRRALIATALINLAMLLCFGPERARLFLEQLAAYSRDPYVWPGNHSLAAYVNQIVAPAFPAAPYNTVAIETWTTRILSLLIIALWAHGTYCLRRVASPARRLLAQAAIAFPVMGAISSTSHDYKLVIFVFPILVSLYFFAEAALRHAAASSWFGIASTLTAAVMLNHSTLIGDWPLQETKFPALVLLFLTTYLLAHAMRLETSPNADVSGAERRLLTEIGIAAAGACLLGGTHLMLKARSDRLARSAASTLTGQLPKVDEPVAAALPDPSGTGPITLTLKLPLAAGGIPEPLLVCGEAGSATMVFIRILPDTRVKLGVEFWGKGQAESPAFSLPASGEPVTITCSLPCLFPAIGSPEWKDVPEARQRHLAGNYAISLNVVVLLEGSIDYKQAPHPMLYYGRNPLGGSLVSNLFTGTVTGAVRN